jgi:hypothetical protein
LILNLTNQKIWKTQKKELLEDINNHAPIKCAIIHVHPHETEKSTIRLRSRYSDSEYEKFLNDLDFGYYTGHGIVGGTIWLQDGTWMTRNEYDGIEWWEHHKFPAIPQELL